MLVWTVPCPAGTLLDLLGKSHKTCPTDYEWTNWWNRTKAQHCALLQGINFSLFREIPPLSKSLALWNVNAMLVTLTRQAFTSEL